MLVLLLATQYFVYLSFCWFAPTLQEKANVLLEGKTIIWVIIQFLLWGIILLAILGGPLPILLLSQTEWVFSETISSIILFGIMFSGMAVYLYRNSS